MVTLMRSPFCKSNWPTGMKPFSSGAGLVMLMRWSLEPCGVVTLTGANTVAGPTAVNGGTLSISANDQLGASAVSLNGGTLRTTNTTALTNTHAITVGAGLIVVLTLLGRDYDGTKIPRRRDGKSDTESHKEKERPEDSA